MIAIGLYDSIGKVLNKQLNKEYILKLKMPILNVNKDQILRLI